MTDPWNPDVDQLKKELEQAKARISEVEAERDRAFLNAGRCIADDRETIATLRSRLEECYQAPDPFHDAGELAAIGHAVEPRDTEPPRREAAAQRAEQHMEKEHWCTSVDPETKLRCGKDAGHEGQVHYRTYFDGGARWEGTPAPEPPPPDGWSDIPTGLTSYTRGCEHKESGRRAWVDDDGLRCMDEMGDDEPCPVDVALWLLAIRGTPGSTEPPVSFTRASIVAWLRLGHVSESCDDDSERADAIERGDDVAWANEQDASAEP